MRKSREQIIKEYHQLSPEAWLEKEFKDFFSKAADSASSREEALTQALDRAIIGTEVLENQEISNEELLRASLRFRDGEENKYYFEAFYRALPTPETLLMLCNINCSPGEEVEVTHYFANEVAIKFSSFWPFGMDCAVMMTTSNALEVLAAQIARDQSSDGESSEDLNIGDLVRAFKRGGLREVGLYLLRAPHLQSSSSEEGEVDWILGEMPENLEIKIYLPVEAQWIGQQEEGNLVPKSLAALGRLGVNLYHQIRQAVLKKSESSF